MRRAPAPASRPPAPRPRPTPGAGAKIAELEAALVHEQSRTQETVLVGAVRERLPRRRSRSPSPSGWRTARATSRSASTRTAVPGEVFIKVSKQGSTLAGIMDAFSISISLGLQHGVPLATYVRKYTNMRFEPAGITDDPTCGSPPAWSTTSSAGWRSTTCPLEERAELGILSTAERMQPTLPGVEETATPSSGIVESVDPVRRR